MAGSSGTQTHDPQTIEVGVKRSEPEASRNMDIDTQKGLESRKVKIGEKNLHKFLC